MRHLSIVRDYAPTPADQARENRMATVLRQFNAATSRQKRIHLFEQYRQLHSQRSPEYVAWMERLRRLR